MKKRILQFNMPFLMFSGSLNTLILHWNVQNCLFSNRKSITLGNCILANSVLCHLKAILYRDWRPNQAIWKQICILPIMGLFRLYSGKAAQAPIWPWVVPKLWLLFYPFVDWELAVEMMQATDYAVWYFLSYVFCVTEFVGAILEG